MWWRWYMRWVPIMPLFTLWAFVTLMMSKQGRAALTSFLIVFSSSNFSCQSLSLLFPHGWFLYTYLSLLKCWIAPFGFEACYRCICAQTHTHLRCSSRSTHIHIRAASALWQQSRPWMPASPSHLTIFTLRSLSHTHISVCFFLGCTMLTTLKKSHIFRPKWEVMHSQFGFGLHLGAKKREKHWFTLYLCVRADRHACVSKYCWGTSSIKDEGQKIWVTVRNT